MKNPEKTEVRHLRLSKKLIDRLLKIAEKSGRTFRGEVEFRLNESIKINN